MLNIITPDNFGKLVSDHYKFLIDEHGFWMVKDDDWTYRFENSMTRIIVMMERAINLVTEIEPIGESATSLLSKNILPAKLGIVTISLCLDENLEYRIEKLNYTNRLLNIPVELEKRAHLLRKYCQKMLKGNFNDWSQIQKCLSERSDEFLEMYWK